MNIARQLKDIQLQADILLSGRPTMTEIVEFHNYNEEVKSYLPTYIKDEELLSRINSIPVIIDETNAQNISRKVITRVIIGDFFVGSSTNELQKGIKEKLAFVYI